MNTKKISCFLPCRKGSERVLKKNIKPFASYSFGLVEVKLKQLLQVKSIDEIFLTTNDDEILDYAVGLCESRITLHKRSEELSSSQTSTDMLIGHALDLIDEGHILWTHVTSPFLNAGLYEEIINRYKQVLSNGYDSLMTTTELYSFLWKNGKPLNYDRTIEKWPRTQTLEAIHEVNSGAFLASVDIYKNLNDRVGSNPFLYPLNKLNSHDIDWPEDFIVAECMAEKGLVTT